MLESRRLRMIDDFSLKRMYVHDDDDAVQGRITGPVLMWVEALELVLSKLTKAGFPFEKVYGVSGSGQQHGSVYWAKDAQEYHLKKLNPLKSLLVQFQGAFSVQDSPVWMDSSTSLQCRAIEKAMGGALSLTELTGHCIFRVPLYFLSRDQEFLKRRKGSGKKKTHIQGYDCRFSCI